MSNQIIHVADQQKEQYELYASLLAKRDQLIRESEVIEIEYFHKFGKLIEDSFTLKVECIRYKKMISFCQAQVNQGKEINKTGLKKYIDTEISAYEAQLHDIQAMRATKLEQSTAYDANRAKRVYREIVKMIHPDLQPELAEHPEIQVLWQETTLAYAHNDARRLVELKIQAAVAIQSITGNDDIPMPNIQNLAELIERIQKEIEIITTTPPYTYHETLRSETKTKALTEQLKAEIKEYKKYLAELKNVFATYQTGEIE